LAKQRGLSKQDAVKLAVSAELARADEKITVREKSERFWEKHPLPEKTGLLADKAFLMSCRADRIDLCGHIGAGRGVRSGGRSI
jgi:hypothetical protein